MGIKTLIMILASLSFSVSALAEHHEESGEKKPFSIYGDFAGSIKFFDNELNGGANHDDFNIDLVEINLEKNWSKSKLHLSIGYGQTALGVNFNPSPLAAANTSTTTFNIMNAYYQMHTSYGLGFSFGKMESPVGHENYNHMDNAQFTRSFGFNLAPFFSTGAMVDYGSDMWKVGLIVSNGSGRDSDVVGANVVDRNKTMGLVVDIDPMENLHIDLNYVTGSEGDNTSTVAAPSIHQINILDVSVAYMINEMFAVASIYIDHGQKLTAPGSTEQKGTSIAAYVNANLGMFGLGLRYEQFEFDRLLVRYNGLAGGFTGVTGTDNSIASITLAATAEIDQNAQVILEYRQDSGDDANTFADKDGAATDSMSTITLGMMYRF